MAYCHFRFHWFQKEMQIVQLDCCSTNKWSLVICKCQTHARTQTPITNRYTAGILFFFFFFINLRFHKDNRAALLSPGESHVNQPGNWEVVIYACGAWVSIECLWILSDRCRNKQIGWKEGWQQTDYTFIFGHAKQKKHLLRVLLWWQCKSVGL